MNTCITSSQEMPRILSSLPVDSPDIGQCDCACVCSHPSESPPAHPDPHQAMYYPAAASIEQPLPRGYSSILSPYAGTFAAVNHVALQGLYQMKLPHSQTDISTVWSRAWGERGADTLFHQLYTAGLILPYNAPRPSLQPMSSVLTTWLHLTDRCTLNCAYCYVPRRHRSMSLKTGRQAIGAVMRSACTHRYQTVKFKYAGGEPLLQWETLRALQHYALAQAEERSLQVEAVVLSNGTLLTETIAQALRRLNVRLMLSLDNLPLHRGAAQRVFPDGRDASAAAIRAIDIALAQDLTPEISVTVSARNIETLPELLAWLLEQELPFSLNFYRDSCPSSPKPRDLQFESDRMISGMLAAYKIIEANLPRRSLLAALADRANLSGAHLRPCSAGNHYLVIDPEGRVSKCQMQMDQPVTHIQQDEPLAALHTAKSGLHNPSVDAKAECQACRWKYWCAGGCPLESYRVTGRYDAKSPNCDIYKALFPEILRLEGLRLLKYAGDRSR